MTLVRWAGLLVIFGKEISCTFQNSSYFLFWFTPKSIILKKRWVHDPLTPHSLIHIIWWDFDIFCCKTEKTTYGQGPFLQIQGKSLKCILAKFYFRHYESNSERKREHPPQATVDYCINGRAERQCPAVWLLSLPSYPAIWGEVRSPVNAWLNVLWKHQECHSMSGIRTQVKLNHSLPPPAWLN